MRLPAAFFVAVAWAAGAVFAAHAQGPRPVLVELFTSQGCGRCPEANALLGELAGRDDVIALSYSVDIWDDVVGWEDTFARPENKARQRAYSQRLSRRVYTPQMVFDGDHMVVGRNRGRVDTAIAERLTAERAGPSIAAGASDGRVRIEVGATPPDTHPAESADVLLAVYAPGPTHVEVLRGENRGRKVPHYNTVTALVHLGSWTGEAASFEIDAAAIEASAVLVQAAGQGPVLAAQNVAMGPES